MSRIYLDYNASTPVGPQVAQAMRGALEQSYGNPGLYGCASAPVIDLSSAATLRVAPRERIAG